ncbi:uncharacterized protein F5891DRAFT_1195338 [Suillus fuscotomentosus]|uniref:Uncharacterized protein n=1 Tax=Suillus fuscotomentosus TaxID=1912939 RepID=A0AAD4HFK0_9AGAM|nr:uncharacterized protein F5891DRAFT_1195338 [Suillus fuscotomentosus]KAG1894356.1 hypothetical protein F5891DRAFT_1195338 [Suillus fuscotomentosus]
MDDLLLQYHNLVNDGEEMGFLDDEEDARMLAATLVAGIELARLDRVETRNPKRLYLCRAHLLPDPHRKLQLKTSPGTSGMGLRILENADLKSWISQQIA